MSPNSLGEAKPNLATIHVGACLPHKVQPLLNTSLQSREPIHTIKRVMISPSEVGRFGMKTTFMAVLIVAAVAIVFGAGVVSAETMAKLDSKPGPAYTMVDGKISKIEGSVYTIESESTGYQNLGATTNVSEMKIYVSEQTKKLHGNKKVGDKVRAEITRGGFANSIQ
jgi:hypothetical protein